MVHRCSKLIKYICFKQPANGPLMPVLSCFSQFSKEYSLTYLTDYLVILFFITLKKDSICKPLHFKTFSILSSHLLFFALQQDSHQLGFHTEFFGGGGENDVWHGDMLPQEIIEIHMQVASGAPKCWKLATNKLLGIK